MHAIGDFAGDNARAGDLLGRGDGQRRGERVPGAFHRIVHAQLPDALERDEQQRRVQAPGTELLGHRRDPFGGHAQFHTGSIHEHRCFDQVPDAVGKPATAVRLPVSHP